MRILGEETAVNLVLKKNTGSKIAHFLPPPRGLRHPLQDLGAEVLEEGAVPSSSMELAMKCCSLTSSSLGSLITSPCS